MLKFRRYFLTLSVSIILLLGAPFQELMADQNSDLIQYRRSLMRSMNFHFNAIRTIIDMNFPLQSQIHLHAKTLHGFSKSLVELFPSGSGPDNAANKHTNSIEDIWLNADEFKAVATSFETASGELLKAAQRHQDNAQIIDTHDSVGEICESCHSAFSTNKWGESRSLY